MSLNITKKSKRKSSTKTMKTTIVMSKKMNKTPRVNTTTTLLRANNYQDKTTLLVKTFSQNQCKEVQQDNRFKEEFNKLSQCLEQLEQLQLSPLRPKADNHKESTTPIRM